MKDPHLLRAGNTRKITHNLKGIINSEALAAIEHSLHENVRQIYRLARHHYVFAAGLDAPHWRHSISRVYYGAYLTNRAIRLFVTGDYSTDVKDHQRFNQLPVDFPNRDRFANQLAILREDRNLSDYDHTANAAELVIGKSASISLVGEFLDVTKMYCSGKGLSL